MSSARQQRDLSRSQRQGLPARARNTSTRRTQARRVLAHEKARPTRVSSPVPGLSFSRIVRSSLLFRLVQPAKVPERLNVPRALQSPPAITYAPLVHRLHICCHKYSFPTSQPSANDHLLPDQWLRVRAASCAASAAAHGRCQSRREHRARSKSTMNGEMVRRTEKIEFAAS